MDQQTKQMKKIIFRLKLKRIIITLILIIICVPIILAIYKGTQNLASKQS